MSQYQVEWTSDDTLRIREHGLTFTWEGGRTLHVYMDGQAIEAREVHTYDTITQAPLTIEQAMHELREYARDYTQPGE